MGKGRREEDKDDKEDEEEEIIAEYSNYCYRETTKYTHMRERECARETGLLLLSSQHVWERL